MLIGSKTQWFSTRRGLGLGALILAAAISIGCPGPSDTPSAPTNGSNSAAPSNGANSDSASDPVADKQEDGASDASESTFPQSSSTDSSSNSQATNDSAGTEPGGTDSPLVSNPMGPNESPNTQTPPTESPTTPPRTTQTPNSTDDPFVEAKEYEGWGEPALVFFVTGRQNGYIEPCGCTGLVNQKGGLLRRDTMLEQLRARGWEMVPIDLGNQEHRFGAQASIKFTKTVEALGGTMGYAAIGLGPDDLRLPSTDLVQAIENSGAAENIFASANVGLFGDYLPKVRIIERAGRKVGITSVLGPKAMAQVNNSDVELTALDQALPAVAKLMDEAGCELKVLMAFASVEETDQIVADHPEFDLVICSGVDGEPTIEPTQIQVQDRTVPVIQTGTKGMYVGVVGWFPGEEKSLRYQRIPLDARFEDSERIKRIFIDYQEQLESMGLAGLDLNPVPHPSGHSFVGTQVCAECHTQAFEVWKNGVDGMGGPHSHATASLVEPNERTWVKRHFDPECLSCHTTGWNPQRYFPYEGGYESLEASKHLFGNGCENCHGPGSAHVAAEMGDVVATADELKALQAQMRVKLDATQCMECHDLDNSPDFHEPGAFEKYWARIIHEGTD